jgi:hypothetical protein
MHFPSNRRVVVYYRSSWYQDGNFSHRRLVSDGMNSGFGQADNNSNWLIWCDLGENRLIREKTPKPETRNPKSKRSSRFHYGSVLICVHLWFHLNRWT